VQEDVARDPTPSVSELADLYRRRFHRFLRVAEAITGDLDAARDAVQEAFARAIGHRADYRGDGSLESWVWSCVVNTARSQAQRREVPVAEPPERPSDEQGAADHALAEAIGSLPERQRHVLFLRYYADLDYRAIAAALDIEVGTVGASLHSAHATLRRLLEEVRQ
jgi:RNA polymerase sigma-70 factor, ECF subfamily